MYHQGFPVKFQCRVIDWRRTPRDLECLIILFGTVIARSVDGGRSPRSAFNSISARRTFAKNTCDALRIVISAYDERV